MSFDASVSVEHLANFHRIRCVPFDGDCVVDETFAEGFQIGEIIWGRRPIVEFFKEMIDLRKKKIIFLID